jgi:hypothetical protein
MSLMQRPSAGEYHENYQKYFDLVPAGAYLELLGQNSKETVRFFAAIPEEKLDYKYAPGKWTIKELLMHVIDTERVFFLSSTGGRQRRYLAALSDGRRAVCEEFGCFTANITEFDFRVSGGSQCDGKIIRESYRRSK